MLALAKRSCLFRSPVRLGCRFYTRPATLDRLLTQFLQPPATASSGDADITAERCEDFKDNLTFLATQIRRIEIDPPAKEVRFTELQRSVHSTALQVLLLARVTLDSPCLSEETFHSMRHQSWLAARAVDASLNRFHAEPQQLARYDKALVITKGLTEAALSVVKAEHELLHFFEQ